MLKILSIVVATFIFYGCGESSDVAEERLSTQQMLDKGEFDGVISKLKDETNRTNEQNIALGNAYLGKSGITFTELIRIIDETDTDENKGDEFAKFVDEISKRKSGNSIVTLGKAKDAFKEVFNGCDKDNDTLTDAQKDICLFSGLASTTKAAFAVSYITDDVTVLADNNDDNEEADKRLKASACAMDYAYNGNTDTIYQECKDGLVDNQEIVTFANKKSYSKFSITLDGREFDFLKFELLGIGQTAVTEGYCSEEDPSTREIVDGNLSLNVQISKENTLRNKGYEVCPVSFDTVEQEDTQDNTPIEFEEIEEVGSLDTLVTVLNDGLDSVSVTDTEDDDIQQQIDDFKKEIKEATYGKENVTEDILLEDITEEQIIKYLNEQNK